MSSKTPIGENIIRPQRHILGIDEACLDKREGGRGIVVYVGVISHNGNHQGEYRKLRRRKNKTELGEFIERGILGELEHSVDFKYLCLRRSQIISLGLSANMKYINLVERANLVGYATLIGHYSQTEQPPEQVIIDGDPGEPVQDTLRKLIIMTCDFNPDNIFFEHKADQKEEVVNIADGTAYVLAHLHNNMWDENLTDLVGNNGSKDKWDEISKTHGHGIGLSISYYKNILKLIGPNRRSKPKTHYSVSQ